MENYGKALMRKALIKGKLISFIKVEMECCEDVVYRLSYLVFTLMISYDNMDSGLWRRNACRDPNRTLYVLISTDDFPSIAETGNKLQKVQIQFGQTCKNYDMEKKNNAFIGNESGRSKIVIDNTALTKVSNFTIRLL